MPPYVRWCSPECEKAVYQQGLEKGRKMQQRAAEKALRAEKKENNRKRRKLNEPKTRKRAAKEACHAYVRYRDRNDRCICCGELLGEDYQAGHFFESGNNPRIRYDEDNIHGQRKYCNTYKGGDSGDYERNLIKKIGKKRVERLRSMRGGTMKRTPDDYREIERYYKNRLKELKA